MNKVEFCKNIVNALGSGTYGDYRGELFFIFDGWSEIESFNSKVQELLDKGEFPTDIGVDLEDADGNYVDYLTDDNWGFCDEYTTCDCCSNVIRTSPDSYSWTPQYWRSEDGICCLSCIDKEEYINSKINNPKTANTIVEDSELVDMGFEKLNVSEYESGFYGNNNNPTEILKMMQKLHSNMEFVFSISNQEQFRTNFDIWGREV